MTTITARLTLFLLPLSCALAQQNPTPDAQVPQTAREVTCETLPDGRVHAEGPRFFADFEPGKASLKVPGRSPDSLPALNLTYLGASRQGAALASHLTSPRLDNGLVSYEHGPVTERYQVGALGFEQSFHFDTRPAGHGDLVLQISAQGNVMAAPAPAAHQLLHFRHQGAEAITYGEAIAFDRGGRRVDVKTRYDGVGLIELIVPADFVDAATYPMVVDPAVGPTFIAPGQIWTDQDPAVACDPLTGNYLVVWQRVFSTTSKQIRSQLFAADGTAITAFGWWGTWTGVNERPDVCVCTSIDSPAFLVVYNRADPAPISASQNGISMQLISATTGVPRDINPGQSSNQAVSDTGVGEKDEAPTIAASHDGVYMLAWQRTLAGATQPRAVMARTIRLRQNTVTGSNVLGLDPVQNIWTALSGEVANVRLPASDVRVAPIHPVSPESGWHALRMVWDRYWDSPAPGDWDVYTCAFRVSYFGNAVWEILDPPVPMSGANGISINERFGDIAVRAHDYQTGTGLQYCIVYQDQFDIHARMMSLTGVTTGEIIVDGSVEEEVMPAVGAGQTEFTVAYGVSVAASGTFAVDVYAARVLQDGTVPINRRPIANAGDNIDITRDVDCESTSYVWDCSDCTAVALDLDASASFDPDGDALSYQWTETTSTLVIAVPTSAMTVATMPAQPAEYGVVNSMTLEVALEIADCELSDEDTISNQYSCEGVKP